MSGALAITQDQQEFSEQQLAVLTQLGVTNASKGDLALFFNQAQRTGLDPFSRQIYMIGRYSSRDRAYKQTIQVGIDGFRQIAHKTAKQCGETFGMEDTLWADNKGRWHDLWLGNMPPAAAKVTVLRNGQRFSAVAVFNEYAGFTKDGELTSMWASKPALMIAKCAEAAALRKAFPADLSGLYTADEMSQADNETQPPTPVVIDPTVPPTMHQKPPKMTPPPQAQPELGEDKLLNRYRQMMSTILQESGVTSKQTAGAVLSLLVGRTVAATADMSRDELKPLIENGSHTAARVREFVQQTNQEAAKQADTTPDEDVIQGEIINDKEEE